MKKLLSVLLCLVPFFASAAALPISDEGKKEAELFMRFIESVYEQQKEKPDSFEYYQRALELAPDSTYLKRQLVAAALTEDKFALAEPYADFITDDSTGEDYTIYAAYLWKNGRMEEAVKAYEHAMTLSPDDTRILYQYVLLLTYTDTDKAVAKLEEQSAEYPSLAPAILMEIGNIYLRKQNFTEAKKYYDKATKLDPEYELPYLGRADIYEKSSQFFFMLYEFEKLEKLGYASAAMYARMASVFLLSQDKVRAEEYFLKAKKEDPSDVASAYFLADFAEQRGDFAQAITYLQDAADYDKNSTKWLQVSFYQQRLNQLPESLKTLADAYKKFNKSVEIGYFYALALQDRKEYKKSAKILREVLLSNPGYDDARLAYANSFDHLKEYKKVDEQLALLLEKNPQNASALNLQAYSWAQRGIRLGAAQELVARALALTPENHAAMDTQGWIYYRLGKPEAAENILAAIPEEVVRLNPEISYHLGAVLFSQGRYHEARIYLELARHEVKEAARLYKKLPQLAD